MGTQKTLQRAIEIQEKQQTRGLMSTDFKNTMESYKDQVVW